jgi:hypothetical protein
MPMRHMSIPIPRMPCVRLRVEHMPGEHMPRPRAAGQKARDARDVARRSTAGDVAWRMVRHVPCRSTARHVRVRPSICLPDGRGGVSGGGEQGGAQLQHLFLLGLHSRLACLDVAQKGVHMSGGACVNSTRVQVSKHMCHRVSCVSGCHVSTRVACAKCQRELRESRHVKARQGPSRHVKARQGTCQGTCQVSRATSARGMCRHAQAAGRQGNEGAAVRGCGRARPAPLLPALWLVRTESHGLRTWTESHAGHARLAWVMPQVTHGLRRSIAH